jgi:exodeoxyribonuclease-3
MKIATYNVNGINARLPALLQWLEQTAPTVACLQELKAPDEKFPAEAIRAAGYGVIWQGQKSWNGVAILARGQEPRETRRGLPGDAEDTQSRYLEAEVDGIRVGCLYLPNGNPAPGPKLDYKMRWFERLTAYAAELRRADLPVVLAGDYNVIPTELDVDHPERWVTDALFLPEVRAAYGGLLNQGWTTPCAPSTPGSGSTRSGTTPAAPTRAMRPAHRPPPAQPALAARLRAAGVDRHVRGWERPSDHAPTWIEVG